MARKKKETVKERSFRAELLVQLVTLSSSGFGFVAALAWNEAIKQLLKDFIEPRIPGSGLISQLIYAIFIIGLAVLVTFQLSRLAARFQKK